MELHNNQVPGDTVWALLVRGKGSYDEHEFVRWFITAEESSAEYRDSVAMQKHKSHAGGTVQRWKVTLPRRRMEREEVDDYVDAALLYNDPDGTVQLLDVSVQ
jgi:hypothetical protein